MRGRAACLIAIGVAIASACGSRSGLLTQGPSEPPPPSADFCGLTEYATGAKDLAIYILLDRSLSMNDDGKWHQATAALGAFVNDPGNAGVAVGLQYFPLGFSCDTAKYAIPAIPIASLPGNAGPITSSLASQEPEGQTPTLPALRGAIEYARALMIAEPSRRAAIALVTDGAPQGCESTISAVASVAFEGSSGSPQVLTFAIGLRKGFVGDLDAIAGKGGTGKPILVSDGPGAGQELVDALRSLRTGLATCRLAVPVVVGAVPKRDDIRVAYKLEPSAPLTSLVALTSLTECGATPTGFHVDDSVAQVELCPGMCQILQSNTGSHVSVAAGCGGSFDAGAPGPLPTDGGDCGGIVSFSCVAQCGGSHITPICVGTIWECPPGTISDQTCVTCSAVPHACCQADGTLADASCIDGDWICPPGGVLYGSPGCTAPGVCAKALPCAVGQYCETPNATCGTGSFAGHCVDIPASCPSGAPPVCACDGKTYPSACQAHAQGFDLSALGDCPAPPGRFACGPLFCALAEICRKTSASGGPALLDGWACVAKPAGCVNGCKCSLCPPCPAQKVCLESCQIDASGGNVLTCSQI